MRDPACTCYLEKNFSVPSDSPWQVIDAECEVVAECSKREFAELIAWSLNNMSNSDGACRLHPNGWTNDEVGAHELLR